MNADDPLVKAHLVKLGRTECREPKPCWTRDEDAPHSCACAARTYRVRAFADLVAGDCEGFPRSVSTWRRALAYTGPIFIAVCLGCGKRDECWECLVFDEYHREPQRTPVDDTSKWWRSVHVLSEDKQRELHALGLLISSVIMFDTCSEDCANKYIREYDPASFTCASCNEYMPCKCIG